MCVLLDATTTTTIRNMFCKKFIAMKHSWTSGKKAAQEHRTDTVTVHEDEYLSAGNYSLSTKAPKSFIIYG